jgi:hypothetical protein
LIIITEPVPKQIDCALNAPGVAGGTARSSGSMEQAGSLGCSGFCDLKAMS